MSLTQKGMNYIPKYGYPVTSTSRMNKVVKIDRILAIFKVNKKLSIACFIVKS